MEWASTVTRWRIATLLLLALFAGVPLLAPSIELWETPQGWHAWDELPRLTELAKNSAVLAIGTLVVVMPFGVLGGILLFRTDLHGRRLCRFLALLAMFVPLPLVTAAWQMALGGLFHGPGGTTFRPQGFLPAIAIHSLVALPWVVVLIGLGTSWVEPELEEDAFTGASAPRVLLRVTLPRALPAVLLAALWTVLLTLNEVSTVTDTLVVRTFAEEVYYQFTGGAGGAGAIAVSLPAILLVAVLAWLVLTRWQRVIPPRQALLHGARVFELGPWHWPLAVLTSVLVLTLVGVPLTGLLWKAGLRYATAASPGPPTWDALLMFERIIASIGRQADLLANSLVLGVGAGAVTAMSAALLCWLARGSRVFELIVGLLAAGLWASPGPVLGVGLHDTIMMLLDWDRTGLTGLLLWERPSPLPNLWLCTLRYLPVALAALSPLARLMPTGLDEAAQLEGASLLQRFVRVFLPSLRWPVLWTGLGVGVLALGELSGSKMLTTPGFKPLAQHVFEQMHYGADSELAALCLVMLGLVGVGGVILALAARRLHREWRS
jgi:ABC-type Fe3+ transport system permease subunit